MGALGIVQIVRVDHGAARVGERIHGFGGLGREVGLVARKTNGGVNGRVLKPRRWLRVDVDATVGVIKVVFALGIEGSTTNWAARPSSRTATTISAW